MTRIRIQADGIADGAITAQKIAAGVSVQGATGVTGATGPAGSTGSVGVTGATGPAGQGFSDGDKGDITVAASGTTLTIDSAAVTYAKIQNVSATDKLLGRSTAGAGSIEEITCTAFGRSLIDNANAAAGRTTLGLGSAARSIARFNAPANQPPASSYATLDTRNSIAVLNFDAATQEHAVFVGALPEAAITSSGLLVRLWWMAASATSGNVRWQIQFEAGGTDTDADSFDTATAATAAANATSGIETITDITATSIDSLSAGARFRLKVTRVAADAADTMLNDAQLVAVEVMVP